MTVARGLELSRGLRATLSGAVTGAPRTSGVPVVVESDPSPRDCRFGIVRRLGTGRDAASGCTSARGVVPRLDPERCAGDGSAAARPRLAPAQLSRGAG